MMLTANHGLGKSDILRHKRAISNIFSSTEAIKISCYPIKFIVIPVLNRGQNSVQVLFSVPVRNIKRAVQRNLIRRRMKEAYRLQKGEFVNSLEESSSFHLGIIYLSKEVSSFEIIQQAFNKFRNEMDKKITQSIG